MDRIERKICEIIDRNQEKIKEFGRDIWTHAELGYRETRTAERFADWLSELGIETEKGLAVTGVKGYLSGKGAKGLTVALMGEFDALPIAAHVDANPETGASHCCGHNAQIAGVVGAALALADPEVRAAMDGNIVFFGVPAEEFVEVDYKNGLREQGVIRYGGGKCELLRIGALDDIDITVGHHSMSGSDGEISLGNSTSNGFVNKMIVYQGRAAHAAGAPHRGIDAMNAAMLAQHAVDMQRESFRDCDTVRIHSFISKGAEAVNVIADDVHIEYSVRAKNIDAIRDASRKVDRCLRAGAIATGCGLTNITLPGYLPTVPAPDTRAVDEAMDAAAGSYKVDHIGKVHGTGSTDYGDVSSIMPLLQFHTAGFEGAMHHSGLKVTDEYLAYVVTAKIFALTAYNLLKNGGDYAHALLESYHPVLTKEQYVEYMESMLSEETLPMAPLPIVEG